ncbi:sensor domain-containing diguanylate cyclase [Nocardia sp. NPDC004568]|uniref:sensor domain-containing diguanylate cyclase n=1 Tax=Nocardia sp. NPDC004568 TaxID=3154551 RepID=UPI0033B8E0FB
MGDELFRFVFDNAAVALAIGDTEGTLLYANHSLADMIGIPVDRLRGISVYQFAHPDDQDEINTVVFDTLVRAREGVVKLERRLIRTDGSAGWLAFTITYVRGHGGQPDYLLAVGEDVTERHRLQEELHRQARQDSLTGLPNRRCLLERIDTLAAAGGDDRAGLCFLDLDSFKEVNDRYGHGIGDQVLRTVADRLRDSVSGHDCMIARIGGDEFVALLSPSTDSRTVTEVAEQMLLALSIPIAIGQHRLRVSASIGAVLTRLRNTGATALLDAADRELYHAKTRGKDQWALRLLDTGISG